MLAKYEPPELRRAIPRNAAMAAIGEALAWAPAVWVGAAPGAGKSTVAALALKQARSGWWYRMDACDRDPASFFADFGALAAQRAIVGFKPPAAYEPAHADDLAAYARRWFRAIFAAAQTGTLIVFDNVQEADPDIAKILTIALDELPGGVHAVFTSHGVPPSDYVNAVSKRRLALFDERLLAFTLDETRALMSTPDTDAPVRVHATSGGWAAGVVMLSAGVASGPILAPSLASSVERNALIRRYFGAEVYPRLSAAARRVLESTALLRDFDARTAQLLSGVRDAEAELDALCDRHLFVMRHGRDARGLPRYALHALFKNFLESRLEDDQRATLYPPSRDALVQLGHTFDAVELAVEHGDHAWAVEQLGECAERLARSARSVRLRELVASLPEELVERRGWVAYWLGMVEVQANELQACRWFERAYVAFDRESNVSGAVAATAAAVFAYQADWANFDGLEAWLDRARRLLADVDVQALSTTDRLRAAIATVCSVLLSPNIDLSTAAAVRAIEILAQSVIRGDDTLDPTERCIASQIAIEAYDLQGRVEEVAPLNAATEALFTAEPVSDLRRGRWYLALGFLHFHHGAAKEADAAWSRAHDIVDAAGLRTLRSDLLRARIQRALNEGRTDEAEANIDELGGLLDGRRPLIAGFYYNFRSRLLLARGQFDEAVDTIDLALAEADRARLTTEQRQFFHVTKSYALLGAERYLEAIPVLDLLRGQFTGKQLSIGDGLIAAADALAHDGDESRFVASLTSAFTHFKAAAPAAFLRPLPELLAQLCAHALIHRVEPDFVRDIVRKRGLHAPAWASAEWPWRVRVFTFDGFRIEIDEQPLVLTGKAPKKPLELLKYLASRSSLETDVNRLLQHLWSDAQGDAARAAFDVAVSRLRKLLAVPEAIVVTDGRCALNRDLVWADTKQLELSVKRARESTSDLDRALSTGKQLLDVYRSEFLRGESEAAWEVEARERYRAMFVGAAETLSETCMRAHNPSTGIALAERAVEIEPLAEKLYAALIRAYLSQGRIADAKRAFRRCEQMLSIMLGVQPSAEVRALVRNT